MSQTALTSMAPMASYPHTPAGTPTGLHEIERHTAWSVLGILPIQLTVGVAIVRFRLGALLRLQPGDLLETAHNSSVDVPLHAPPVGIAWGEFEVIEDRLSLRITRLA
jgi:flagellar motor switch/type III secretory pathway protein FliN